MSVALLTPKMRAALRPPPELTIDRWAEEHLYLPRATSEAVGRISFDRTPFAREILRMATDPDVEEITLCFAAQVVKTTVCIAIVLYHVAEDPWPCLHVLDTEDDACNLNVERYQAIIRESPSLSQLLSGAKHDLTRDAIRLNGISVNFVGARSPGGLASRPVCILVLDETDKYPEFAGREADPIALARERTTTFTQRKVIKASTPTTEQGYIWREFTQGDQRRYHVPCPHCGGYQLLVFGAPEPGTPGIKVPEGERDVERIITEQLAWYECEHCHGRILDADKPKMLQAGRWVPACQKITPSGEITGRAPPRRKLSYHLSRLYSPWANTTWSHVIAEFFRAARSRKDLMNFRNSWLAEIWEEKVQELRGAHLRERMENYRQKEVPEDAYILIAGVDVQVDHLWYAIRAFGARGRSWLVRYGQVPNWEALRTAILRSKYIFCESKKAAVMQMVLVDSGYRTDEVYRVCRRNGYQPTKGTVNARQPWRLSRIKGKNATLANIDVEFYKTKLHRLIQQDGDAPDAWSLPCDVREDYFVHLTAEQRVLERSKATGRYRYRWKITHDGAPNHLFDCEVLCLVGADILDVENRWRDPPPSRLKGEKVAVPKEEATCPEEKESEKSPKVRFKRRRFGRLR